MIPGGYESHTFPISLFAPPGGIGHRHPGITALVNLHV